MKPGDVTLLIQGPLDPTSLSRVGDPLVGETVVSFWQAERNACLLQSLLCPPGAGSGRPGWFTTARREPAGGPRSTFEGDKHDVLATADAGVLLVEIGGVSAIDELIAERLRASVPDGEDPGSAVVEIPGIYRQLVSTLAGLEQVRTRHVIKLRSDEFYGLTEVVRRLDAQPGKIVVNNIFMDGVRHFKISDHLIAGATDDVRQMFQIAKQRWEAGDVYMQGINPHGGADPYQRRGGMNTNQLLGTSMILARGGVPSIGDSVAPLAAHFDVVPLAQLRPYRWAFSRRYADPGFVARVAADPMWGESLGLTLSASHVFVSSVDTGVETPAIAAGLFGDIARRNSGGEVGFRSIAELARRQAHSA